MIIPIPHIFKTTIETMPGNKTKKANAFKVYAALHSKLNLANKDGYFPISSEYLESVNSRYYTILDYFIEKGLLDYHKKPYIDENDVFNTIYKKSYDAVKGICMKYKFTVDFNDCVNIEVDTKSNKSFRWYDIVSNSLKEKGFDTSMFRCDYGRRLHHKAITTYEDGTITTYKEHFIGYWKIDAQCSQPRLLYDWLVTNNVNDIRYNEIFSLGKDFYIEVQKELGLSTRKQAQDLFCEWVNGKGWVSNTGITKMFPIVTKIIKQRKLFNYKEGGSFLQRLESKIWIDDLLNNLPVDFAIPIHDCLVVKEQDKDIVLNYCKTRQPNIVFDVQVIK
jgi:hypothetical protein